MSDLRLRASRLQWLETDGDVVALDEESLLYLSTNASGALLWQALARGTSHAELVDLLAGAYGLERERAAEDVERYLADLDARGLLER